MVENTQIVLFDLGSGSLILETQADEIVSTEGSTRAQSHQGPVDQPGTDDLLITNVSATSLLGETTPVSGNYVVRLNAGQDDVTDFGGKNIQWQDETGTIYTGTISSALDEVADTSFTLFLSSEDNAWLNQIQFGFPQGTSFVEAKDKDYPHTNFQKIQKQIADDIPLYNGDTITPESIHNIEQVLKEQFKSKVADIIIRPTWVGSSGNSIQLTILVVPPVSEVTTVLTNTSLQSDTDVSTILEDLNSYYQPGAKGFTYNDYIEGSEQLMKSLRNSDQYYIRSIDEPYLSTDGRSIVVPISLTIINNNTPQLIIVEDEEGRPLQYFYNKRDFSPQLLAAMQDRGIIDPLLNSNDLPGHLNRLPNAENIEANVKAIEKYYGRQGKFVDVKSYGTSSQYSTYRISLQESPKNVSVTGLPQALELDNAALQEMFVDTRYDWCTAASIKEGLETLTHKIDKAGYGLIDKPSIEINGNTLQVSVTLLRARGNEYQLIKGRSDFPDENFGELQEALDSRLPQPDADGYVNVKKLERALGLIRSDYNVEITYRVENVDPQTGEADIQIPVDVIQPWLYGGSAGLRAGPAGVGVSATGRVDYVGKPDRSVGGSLRFYHEKYGEDFGSIENTFLIPEIHVSGAHADVLVYSGLSVQIPLSEQTTYPFTVANRTEFTLVGNPVVRPLIGVDTHFVMDKDNSGENNGLWVQPYGGLQLIHGPLTLRATTGPALNPFGIKDHDPQEPAPFWHWETEASGTAILPTGHAGRLPLSAETNFAIGLRAGPDVPIGEQYYTPEVATYDQVSLTGSDSRGAAPFHAELREDFMFNDIIPNWLDLGVGGSLSVSGDQFRPGVGIHTRLHFGPLGTLSLFGGAYVAQTEEGTRILPGFGISGGGGN